MKAPQRTYCCFDREVRWCQKEDDTRIQFFKWTRKRAKKWNAIEWLLLLFFSFDVFVFVPSTCHANCKLQERAKWPLKDLYCTHPLIWIYFWGNREGYTSILIDWFWAPITCLQHKDHRAHCNNSDLTVWCGGWRVCWLTCIYPIFLTLG